MTSPSDSKANLLPTSFVSPIISPSSSSPSSSEYDDSSDIDELDLRSKKLTRILKKNINKTEKRKSVLDVVKEKAWLLEDQVKLLERQTANIRGSLTKQTCRRRIVVLVTVILSLFLIINRSIFSGMYQLIENKLNPNKYLSHNQNY